MLWWSFTNRLGEHWYLEGCGRDYLNIAQKPGLRRFQPLKRGALPLWRWRRCKAPKIPYFQCWCYPMTPYFCWLSLMSLKDPTFFLVKYGLFDRSHPKTPYFLHSAATGSYFLFQFHRQIDHFCHFRWFFSKFLLLKHSLKDQK